MPVPTTKEKRSLFFLVVPCFSSTQKVAAQIREQGHFAATDHPSVPHERVLLLMLFLPKLTMFNLEYLSFLPGLLLFCLAALGLHRLCTRPFRDRTTACPVCSQIVLQPATYCVPSSQIATTQLQPTGYIYMQLSLQVGNYERRLSFHNFFFPQIECPKLQNLRAPVTEVVPGIVLKGGLYFV